MKAKAAALTVMVPVVEAMVPGQPLLNRRLVYSGPMGFGDIGLKGKFFGSSNTDRRGPG